MNAVTDNVRSTLIWHKVKSGDEVQWNTGTKYIVSVDEKGHVYDQKTGDRLFDHLAGWTVVSRADKQEEPAQELVDHAIAQIVAPITGYRAGSLFASAEGRCVMIRNIEGEVTNLTPSEARALLKVLPALIEIADAK